MRSWGLRFCGEGLFRKLLVFKAYAHQVMLRLSDSMLAIGSVLKSLVNPLLIWSREDCAILVLFIPFRSFDAARSGFLRDTGIADVLICV